MRKILSIILAAALVLSLCACGGNGNAGSGSTGGTGSGAASLGNAAADFVEAKADNPTTMGLFYRNTIGANIASNDPDVKAVDEKADALLKAIEDAPDTLKANGGKTYYVSAEGKDTNDGLTPETAKKDYMALKTFLKEGDLVLFRRGDVFRGQVILVSGVSYSAYGEGPKPRFYGSTDAKNEGTWEETETPHVYKYSKSIGNYSNIVFNSGEAVGRPVKNLNNITKKALNTCWQGKIYVYSPDGNPGEIFHHIEIVDGYSLFTGGGADLHDVHVQNLCLMYAGVHGFGSLGYCKNVTIEGCIIGFMGGKDLFLQGKSLGNAIEFMGGANNCTVRNNYLFQCYDTGVTHQGPMNNSRSADFDNLTYDNNLIEYCVWAIESWIYGVGSRVSDDDAATGNTWVYGKVDITNNICRYTGWGWGSLDRPDKNVYADLTYNFHKHEDMLTVSGNIFDRSRRFAIRSRDIYTPNTLSLTNNTILVAASTRIIDEVQDISKAEETLKTFAGTLSGNTIKKVN